MVYAPINTILGFHADTEDAIRAERNDSVLVWGGG